MQWTYWELVPVGGQDVRVVTYSNGLYFVSIVCLCYLIIVWWLLSVIFLKTTLRQQATEDRICKTETVYHWQDCIHKTETKDGWSYFPDPLAVAVWFLLLYQAETQHLLMVYHPGRSRDAAEQDCPLGELRLVQIKLLNLLKFLSEDDTWE